MVDCRILLVTFPIQGQINPSLQFAKRLIERGIMVIFATSVSAIQRMSKNTPTLQGLTFAALPDGSVDGSGLGDDTEEYMNMLKIHGSPAIEELVRVGVNEGRPIKRVIYTTFLSWVPSVARGLHVPSTLLWIQPATVFDICYYYFNGYCDYMEENTNIDPSCPIELPGLPPLTSRDLPSVLLPLSHERYALPTFKEHFEILGLEKDPQIVLVNTFEALEPEALRAIEKLKVIPIGPLVPSAFLDGKVSRDSSFEGDLFEKSSDVAYMKWLRSMPESSVVYVSFGSVCMLSKRQMEEIARGLLDSGRPFLWVMRTKENEDKLSCIGELEKQGVIVEWCSQLEVLSDPSLGCFVTHCGWNSSLESLVSGVPVVGCPLCIDQGTNAKLIEDVWKTGLRAKASDEEGIFLGEEIKRCIEIVMGGGERACEMRSNAKKWKDLAREAVKEGGSSDVNLKGFVRDIRELCLG